MQTSSATIVVTDSGLGGLSTAAHLVHRLREEKPLSQARVIYFNAHAASGFGYNELGAGPRQIQLFDRALEAAGRQDSADHILVACNTLSVLIDQTPYAQSHPTQVVGIVDAGVEAMLAYWERYPDAGLLIFGTPTTIGSGVYQRRLLAAGISEEQFHPIACPVLHGLIERGPDEEVIYRTIREHIGKGLPHLNAAFRERVGVSLNCTHYGYAKPAFQEGLQQNGISLGKVISPNASMVSFLF
ncbi:MAG: aspartate/glutamate racemase family protein, partial [Myxococcota bacterium]|nr:aspartate/glutamate racemase family protein [Myxococcota bacterium]